MTREKVLYFATPLLKKIGFVTRCVSCSSSPKEKPPFYNLLHKRYVCNRVKNAFLDTRSVSSEATKASFFVSEFVSTFKFDLCLVLSLLDISRQNRKVSEYFVTKTDLKRAQ